MIKAIYQIEAKVADFVSNWHFDMQTPIEVLEQMCLQYLQHLAQAKAANAAQAQIAPSVAVEPSAPLETAQEPIQPVTPEA